MDKIVISNVSKNYLDVKGNSFSALKNISFEWNSKENIAIIGESGSGKSTLARLIIGIEKPSSGQILIENEDSVQWNFRRFRKVRHKLQAVFQDASGTLNPAHSVYRNLEQALRNLSDLNSEQRKQRIYELMELTNMKQDLLKVPVKQLSGGEQRRLSLLRALSLHPNYLILDEVTSGLDLISADAVLSVLEKYHSEYGCAYLLITHDKQNAYRIADRILEIQKGEIITIGQKINNK